MIDVKASKEGKMVHIKAHQKLILPRLRPEGHMTEMRTMVLFGYPSSLLIAIDCHLLSFVVFLI